MTSSASPDVTVTIHAGSPLAEVFLIDHRFALVERSVGDLEATVSPGVYKAKARLGDAETERLVMLDRDQAVDLSKDLDIASPVPLAGTRLGSTAQALQARDLSAVPAADAGLGSAIFVMARGTEPDVALLDATTGTRIGGLEMSPQGPWTMTSGVAPGPYRLRWHSRAGVRAEQTVQAVEHWQTQVFLFQEPGQGTDLGGTRVSMLMGRDGFEPGDAEVTRVEEARTALADERKVASPMLNETLFEKFENPMLGLFGAHLMLIARDAEKTAEDARSTRRGPRAPVQFTPERFATVVHNLQGLLGETHPDVVAIATQVPDQPPAALPPIASPPMLWRSWILLLEASNLAPELVPVDVWRPAAAPLPLRPFLIWARDDGGAERHLTTIAARALARSGDDRARRALTHRLLMPRAAVDAVAPGM